MTRAITALVDIMTDTAAPLRRRIEATAGLLEYEAPAEMVELAVEFLSSVFEDPDQHVDDRLDATKLMRKFEAKKIVKPSAAPADDPANRQAWRRLETAQRRMSLIKAGKWPPPPDWADDLLGPGYRPPPGAGNIIDTTNLAGRMKAARERQQR